MKNIKLQITHPKRKINFFAIEKRIKSLGYASYMNTCSNEVEVIGNIKASQITLVKNALFQIGYSTKVV